MKAIITTLNEEFGNRVFAYVQNIISYHSQLSDKPHILTCEKCLCKAFKRYWQDGKENKHMTYPDWLHTAELTITPYDAVKHDHKIFVVHKGEVTDIMKIPYLFDVKVVVSAEEVEEMHDIDKVADVEDIKPNEHAFMVIEDNEAKYFNSFEELNEYILNRFRE